MPTPTRPDEQVQAFADAFNANGGNATRAVLAIGLKAGSAASLKADALTRGLITDEPRWKPVRRSTSYDKDDNITATHVQEKPDRGECVVEPLPNGIITRRTVHRVGGEIVQTWETENAEVANAVQEFDRFLTERKERLDAVRPYDPVPPPKSFGPASLINQITIADGHVGALAWHEETGSGNWDLSIARSTMLAGTSWLCDSLPSAETVILKILGDFLDADGYAPLTPASKHLLDVDGRFPRMVDVAADIIEDTVRMLLRRYRKVLLVIRPGNHDPLSAMWLRKYFTRVFANEPRVEVDQSLRHYWAMLFGKTMISAHHGDKAALGELPGIFAADFAEIWGGAVYRVCHTGHMHHKKLISHIGEEKRGMLVIQHPTVAKRNAWAAEKGLSAARELLGHTYHEKGAMVTTLHFNADLMRTEEAA